MKTLSVIIPYRDRLENLRVLAENVAIVDKTRIEFLLIVLGDNDPEVILICERADIKYHYISDSSMFCIGKAHNLGAEISTGVYIMKQDTDTLPYQGFYENLLNYIDIHFNSPFQYLIIGCYFAGKEYSSEKLCGIVNFQHVEYLKNTPGAREKFFDHGPEGTMFVINRASYSGFGGCSKEFKGHGWEDYQVSYMIAKLNNPSLKLPDYTPSAIRLFVVLPANVKASENKLVLVHRWHTAVNDPQYYAQKANNAGILRAVLTSFDQDQVK